ncbi:MAG TPA: prevent-host-death protein [Chloroflexota bacterium]|nr:prevent-host-death protein [Chloroflexota bacterium]
MRTIPAREIKRRGIGVVDDLVKEGPVHVIKDDRPTYVIMDETHYRELVEAQEETFRARLAASLEDLRAGRIRRSTAQEIIDEYDLEK